MMSLFHWIPASYHWLVNEGLLRDVVAVVSAGLLTPILNRIAKQHLAVQKDIADKLDSSTAGGLADVVSAIQSQQPGSVGSGPGGDSSGN